MSLVIELKWDFMLTRQQLTVAPNLWLLYFGSLSKVCFIVDVKNILSADIGTMIHLARLLHYLSLRKYYSFDCFYRIVHIKLKDHFATQYYNKFLLGNRENEKLSIGRFVIAFNTSLSNGRKFLPTKNLPSTCVRKEKNTCADVEDGYPSLCPCCSDYFEEGKTCFLDNGKFDLK